MKPESNITGEPNPWRSTHKIQNNIKPTETNIKLASFKLMKYSLLVLIKLQVVISSIPKFKIKKQKKAESNNK